MTNAGEKKKSYEILESIHGEGLEDTVADEVVGTNLARRRWYFAEPNDISFPLRGCNPTLLRYFFMHLNV